MSDRSTRLIVAALARAAASPSGTPLFAGKNDDGLFPAGTAAKQAAQRCKDQGLLEVVRTEPKGRAEREVCAVTESGLRYLTEQADPRLAVEDFTRCLEEREDQVERLLAEVGQLLQSLRSTRSAARGVLDRLAGGPTPDYAEAVLARLGEWHESAGASEDCPLPELYRRVAPAGPPPSVGQFHDCLRGLHAAGRVHLHPWTGPLYECPEPTFALLSGHEVAYYASLNTRNGVPA